MADVKKIDIDGVQWDIKDQEARNKLAEVDKVLEIQKTVIDELVQLSYINKRVAFECDRAESAWIKVNNLYTKRFFENNIFAFTSRNGEYHQIVCGITDENKPVEPLWTRFYEGTHKIYDIRYKDNIIWVSLAGWSVLRVQQMAGSPVKIVLTEETPPTDAVSITMKQIQIQ